MDALHSMPTFLRSRPPKFKSLPYAIEWDVRSGQVRNHESARVSMPGQLKNCKTGKCATFDVDKAREEASGSGAEIREKVVIKAADSISEEAEDGEAPTPKPEMAPPKTEAATETSQQYEWRIDLAASQPHWTGWFSGLSNKFLSVPAAKLLLLAGVDRLDRDLTVGQMQGKFQMQILPQAGHAVHEDVPDRVADLLATFLVRNKFAEPCGDYQHVIPSC